MAFADRIIKLNDYLLEQAASRKSEGRSQKEDTRRGKTLTSSVLPLTSRVPVHLQSVAALANQLLRSGTRADFKSKSFIALKEARESLYWIDLLHRNGYLDDKQYQSIYDDAEELVKILVTRCKKINEDSDEK